uniref:Uncharacterized protein n=1 Tax=Panagrolaimus sp. PS1159 TaxID=55785 RepID=A0AC35FYV7_9BILA
MMLVINNVFICLIPFIFFADAGKLNVKDAAKFMGIFMSKMKNFAGNDDGNYAADDAVSGTAAVPLFGNVIDFVDGDGENTEEDFARKSYEHYFPLRIKCGASNKEYTSYKAFSQNVLNDLKDELGNTLSYCINLEDRQVEFQNLLTDIVLLLIEAKYSNKFFTFDHCLL